MKKLVLGILMLLGVFLGGTAEAKPIVGEKGQVIVEIPDLAPDFTKWQGEVLGVEQFDNGNIIAILRVANADQTVVVDILMIRLNGEAYIVGMAVLYARTGKVDTLEDPGLMAGKKLERKLVYVEKPTSIEEIKMLLSKRSL